MTMTTELQRAMAEYEEARLRYKRALLTSMGPTPDKRDVARAATEFQRARRELRRLQEREAEAARPQVVVVARMAEDGAGPVRDIVRRFVKAVERVLDPYNARA